MKIYLNSNGDLEIVDGSIKHTIPAGTTGGRWDYDNSSLYLHGGVIKTTSIADIFKKDGSPYVTLAALNDSISTFFASTKTIPTRLIRVIGAVTYICKSISTNESLPTWYITKIEIIGGDTVFTYAEGALDDILTLTYTL